MSAVGAGWALACVLELGGTIGSGPMAWSSAAGVRAMDKSSQLAASVAPIWTEGDQGGPARGFDAAITANVNAAARAGLLVARP